MYTLEINGRGTVVADADSLDEAEAIFLHRDFKSDLMLLETDGAPLWNGKDELVVRRSSPEEEARQESSRAEAKAEGAIDGDDDEWITFLVPVTDPTDDEDGGTG
jgi:hypothetical protein